MEIKRYYLTQSENTRRMEKTDIIEYIIVTSSKYNGFSALKNRNVIEKLKYKQDKEFSCHYIIEGNGRVLNIIPDKERAICTGNIDIDDKSISIMLTLNKDGKYEEAQIYSLKRLIKKLMKKYDIDDEHVLREYDINCSRRPAIFADESIILWEIIHSK